jgi:hypothetical protein
LCHSDASQRIVSTDKINVICQLFTCEKVVLSHNAQSLLKNFLIDDCYFVPDPSCLFSIEELEASHRILMAIQKEARGKVTIIIPTLLYQALESMLLQRPVDVKEVARILREWDTSSRTQDQMENIVRQLSENSAYLELLKVFLDQYNPLTGEKAIEGNAGVPEEYASIIQRTKGEISDGAKQVLAEILALSSKLKAKVMSFGRGIANVLGKAKIKFAELKSEWKDYLKRHTGVKQGLKIGIMVGSVALAGALISHGVLPAAAEVYFGTIANEGFVYVLLNG